MKRLFSILTVLTCLAFSARADEPVKAIIYDLDALYMFSFKENRETEEKAFVTAAEKMLKSYMKASEIKDDISHMVIYLDKPDGNTCHEMVMLITWPSTSMMVFHGDFTEDSLRRMDEISKKQRAEGGGLQKGLYRNEQLPEQQPLTSISYLPRHAGQTNNSLPINNLHKTLTRQIHRINTGAKR